MSGQLKTTGCLSEAELAAVLPAPERMAVGPVAVIECIQDIPCNPCEAACAFGAIRVGQPITSTPVLDADKCKGCGLCIAKCPGLAIFVVDTSAPGEAGTVQMPYEYWPVPEPGERVVGHDRRGQAVCEATVAKVLTPTGADHTSIVTVTLPKAYVNTVRSVRRREGEGMEETMICRCEEVTEAEIKQAIHEGAGSLADVKRRTGAGMGLCQGRTCRRLVSGLICKETGQTADQVKPDTVRSPVRPVTVDGLLTPEVE